LLVAVIGVTLAQQMIMQNNPNLFREILSELYYPCEHTMRLLALAADMAAFEPDARPDMAEVARRLAEIAASGGYTHSLLNTSAYLFSGDILDKMQNDISVVLHMAWL
jgi:hypothetical protein